MNDVTLVRRIKARPSIVFDALTTTDGVAAWWGPEGATVLLTEVDARVGGAYRVRFRNPDGVEHESVGTFLELVAPRRVTLSWQWAAGGEPDERGRTSRVEIDLVPFAGGTELTFRHLDLGSDVSARSHEGGWSGALDKLVRLAEGAGDRTGRDEGK